MSCDKTSFAIKTTNWCNLNCAHCSECSGPRVRPDIMPLADVERYIAEFNAMPIPRWEYMVFTGGEAMAPYYHKQMDYVPRCLDFAAQHKMAPFVKTNAVWGADAEMRNRILRDFANAAYRNNILMSLDISVDEFHNNERGVLAIINDVVRSDFLAPAVRLSIVSLNTQKSNIAMLRLIQGLQTLGFNINHKDKGVWVIELPGVRAMQIYYDVWTNVSRVGRAAENNLGTFVPAGQPDDVTGNCLQIDNKNIATLNYKYQTPVNGRKVYDVARELFLKTR